MMEIDISEKTVRDIANLLKEPADKDPKADLDEAMVTSNLSGYVQFRGFDDEVSKNFPKQIKLRVQAVRTGGRVRVTIDIA